MITRINRFITDIDQKEHNSYAAAEEHIADLCREKLDALIMKSWTAKEGFVGRGNIVALVNESFTNKKTILEFVHSLNDILRGEDEREED